MRIVSSRKMMVASLAAGAGLVALASPASASTLRVSSSSALPTASSPIVPTQSSVGTGLPGATTNGLVAPATLTMPNIGSGPVLTSCSRGNVSSRISGANPAPVIDHDSAAMRIESCTDVNEPNVDLDRLSLATPSDATTSYSASTPDGLWTLAGPTFTARVRTSSGLFFNCSLVLYSPGAAAWRIVNDDAGQPTLSFSNLRLRSQVATSRCASQFGDGSSLAQSTTLSAKFGPLRLLGVPSGTAAPLAGAVGNPIGIFP